MPIYSQGLFLGDSQVSLVQNNNFVYANPFYEPIYLEYYVIAGGGGGGLSNAGGGGGGGAGGLLSGSIIAEFGSFPVIVGGGGAALGDVNTVVYVSGSDGSNSSILFNSTSSVAIGGGGGGGGSSLPFDGNFGGSGGGGAQNDSDAGLGGSGSLGQGYRGATGSGGFRAKGGGGGGAFQSGSNENGGPGVTLLNGVLYSQGGNGAADGDDPQPLKPANTGFGGNGGNSAIGLFPPSANPSAGASGAVIVSYPGDKQLAIGGVVGYDSGSNYTYHVFNSSGRFSWILPE